MNQAILQSLLKPQAYPEATERVDLRQTHVSFLFFTDSHVYKVKKPVNFGFLDFSTLDRRRFYCEEEVRLNSRLSPDLYEGVVELRESDGRGSFSGTGRITDYAVKMRRLPEEGMLKRLVERGEVTEREMITLAATIAAFHAGAARGPEIARYGGIEAITANWNDNLAHAAEFVGETSETRDLKIVGDWAHAFVKEQAPLLGRRCAEGFIRDGHGDLHLENICIADKIYIFDCIEFSERLRCCDTASDLAFLLMDLDYRGRSDLAEIVLREYVSRSGDTDLPLLTGFYKTYRAVVRGKVESLRLRDPLIPANEKRQARERARKHFRLARGYVLRLGLRKSLLITCGLTGSGKSSLAREISFQLGIETVGSDVTRKRLAGVGTTERRPDLEGTGLYSANFDAMTYEKLREAARAALSRGESIIVDATFRRRSDRDGFAQLARKAGADFYVIEGRCPDAVLRERLTNRALDPAAVSDGRVEILESQEKSFEWPQQDEGRVIAIDTTEPMRHNADLILHAMELL
jgi:uncharacterized protein